MPEIEKHVKGQQTSLVMAAPPPGYFQNGGVVMAMPLSLGG